MDFEKLKDEPRLLIEVPLKPLQGARFQPTGFPDIGAATSEVDGSTVLLVESAQSMANRLEAVCWDEAAQKPIAPLNGMPYVETSGGSMTTNSLLEAHRINSPYIVNSKEFDETIKNGIGFEDGVPFDRLKFARVLLKYDPNSIVHGVFLEKVAGVIRLPRILSAFIEANNASVIPSGGVKIDRVRAGKDSDSDTGGAEKGYGNVPFHREEYLGDVKAYFNLDLAQLRGYNLSKEAESFLIALALLKIRRFLKYGLRLRTACDLCAAPENEWKISPAGFSLPKLDELEKTMPKLIGSVNDFANPPKSMFHYEAKKEKKAKKDVASENEEE